MSFIFGETWDKSACSTNHSSFPHHHAPRQPIVKRNANASTALDAAREAAAAEGHAGPPPRRNVVDPSLAGDFAAVRLASLTGRKKREHTSNVDVSVIGAKFAGATVASEMGKETKRQPLPDLGRSTFRPPVNPILHVPLRHTPPSFEHVLGRTRGHISLDSMTRTLLRKQGAAAATAPFATSD